MRGPRCGRQKRNGRTPRVVRAGIVTVSQEACCDLAPLGASDGASAWLVAAHLGFLGFTQSGTRNDTIRNSVHGWITGAERASSRGCARPCVRPDADDALSYGKGRVFFTALGHTPAFFSSTDLSDFFFRGRQFVLGDLDADATPSGKQAAGRR